MAIIMQSGIGNANERTMTFLLPILSAIGPPKNVPAAPNARNKNIYNWPF